ncbi:protein grpe [Stylonychia lemnae]|uniref:Protein grpe n=1 Tax=Stylonychia lemnae TaxID=5949 RepID=A0A078ALH4_STYLE|nr:protein grpe [Stylonychia lemnae]|eukprot:CDW83210.1 protein grpe [Stylonychia lemnae]
MENILQRRRLLTQLAYQTRRYFHEGRLVNINRLMQKQPLNLTQYMFLNGQSRNTTMLNVHSRAFTQKTEKQAEPAAAKKEETSSTAEQIKKEVREENKKAEAGSQQKQQDKSKKAQDDSSSSSSDEEAADKLSREDVKAIKKLISEQETEIETLKAQVKSFKEKLVYQLAENDNTIKRYQKEINQTKEFAITKFAKDLLDVRDNLQLASDHIKKLNLEEITDIKELKGHFEQQQKGMVMTSSVMDNTLKRFGVIQFDPKGEKFDPNLHEAVFTIPDPTKEANTVAEVMQSGWKIGDRVLRAAKVGIVKK